MVIIYNSGPSGIATLFIVVILFANTLLLAEAVSLLQQILEAMKEPQRATQQQQQAQSNVGKEPDARKQQARDEEVQQQQPMPDRAINRPSGLVSLGGATRRTGYKRLSDL
jgi:predicted Holliday junction resolvase-like endonuclease